eukprot:s5935_g1.t1
MGAGSVYSTESFLSSLGVPPPDKPVRVGLVRCDRSVPPEAQAKYDYVHKARQEYQLGPHEINAEMLATRDLVDAVTLRATLLAACYHDNVTSGTAHRADIFRYVDHYLRGGLYLDIKTALLEPLVDQQDLSGFRYMPFCEELFRVIKADRYQGAGTPLQAGWVLGLFGLGPIYLLQETHEPALKTAQPKGLPNDGHCFRTAGGQMVALTRCWKWNKGDVAGKQAQWIGHPRPSGGAGTGTAGAPNPKDESGTKAPPPAETSVPYERAKAPEPEPSRQRTIAELCSTKDFVEWVTAVADFQVWSSRSRMETLAKTPTIMCDLPNAGQVLPRATLWVGGLHAFLQHAIHLSFHKREVSEANFKLFALAFQTIYDAAAKRAHNSTRCVTHYATGNSEEEGATLKLTHGETAFQKFRAVTGLEPSLQQDEDLLTVATHARTSERQRTITAGIGMKIGELLPNGLGNRGSPIAGTNDAFSPS